MKISCVIPNFNDSRKLIKSVKICLKYCDEVIVVDDCSIDDSVKKLRTIKNKKLRIYRNKINSGSSYSRNFGFNKTKYEKILFIDSDCYLNKTNFIKLLNYEGIVYPNITDSNGKCYNFHPGQKYLQNSVCFLISRDDFNKVGGFDKNIRVYMDDVDFFFRACKINIPSVFVSHSKGYHDGKRSQKSISQSFFLNLKNTTYFCLKHSRFSILRDDFPNGLTLILNLRRCILNRDRLYNSPITSSWAISLAKGIHAIFQGVVLYIQS